MRSFVSAAVVLFASTRAAMAQGTFYPGVIATGTQGTTNPPEPTMGTAINQTSYSRLLSVNSIDDFCIFAPPYLANISDSETFEVAWCTQQRNNARLIPDGTLTGVSFLQTDAYIQVYGYGDFTNLNIPEGDWGGELDPHGAYGSGNPIGGNVTSNISGTDEPYAEWMLYIDYNQFCLRVCTAANSTYSAAEMCWHELDEMGCEFVMPGNYNFNGTFETCEADVAYPPGWYPTATVSGTTYFSTFAQYYTGVVDGVGYTVGDTVTPTAVYFTPSSSNCVSTATVSNGVALDLLGVTSSGAAAATGTAAVSGSVSGASASVAKATGTASAGSSGSPNGAAGSMSQMYPVITFVAVLSGAAAVLFLH
ncbi:hypothetical protein H0H92_006695 [Tricholoma furcatifolium]|nr:hypothetical protein H0H92_006695 [Tricholoma furcatifolium]